MGVVRRRLFGIPSELAVFSRRGFAPEARQRFAPVVHALAAGYHATLEDSRFDVLVPRLDAVEPELRGFAYEGAGMGLAALDMVAPWRSRLQEFVTGPGADHIHPIYIGAGLALARVKRRPEPYLKRLDPVVGWVVVDGYGFHAGFFARRRYVEAHASPKRLSGPARRIFDQGLGRSIWFSCGALVERVAATVGAFPPARQPDLWSGVAMACAYGGGAERAAVRQLRTIAEPYRAQLARGAAIAAGGRERAGIRTEHTDLACEVFCGLSSEQAARVLHEARADLPPAGGAPGYQIWQQRTEAQFSA